MKTQLLKSFDEQDITIYIWDDVEEPIGILHIAHGMAEHAKRYADFATYLNQNQWLVVSSDHRGHGETGKRMNSLGYLGKDGFNTVVRDQFEIKKYIQSTYTNLNYVIMGHSFGSFITQAFIEHFPNEANAYILSGSAYQKVPILPIAKAIAYVQMKTMGEKTPSRLLDSMSFGSFNKPFQSENTNFAWLSSDLEQVNQYIQDEYCGFVCSTNFFYSLFDGLTHLYNSSKLTQNDQNIPIYIFSGDQDPVGNNGESVKKLAQYYSKHFQQVTLHLYPNGRHEMLNEVNRMDVYKDVVKFLNQL